MQDFEHGPFEYRPAAAGRWSVYYGGQHLGTRKPEDDGKAGIIEALAEDVGAFVADLRKRHAPDVIELVESSTEDVLARIEVCRDPGLTAGRIDDRSRFWLRSENGLRSLDVSLAQYARIAAECMAPERHWIAGLLPDDVLTTDPEAWRAPTSAEIRRIVGEASFTGISGAKAAMLVGVTPQNFRKYTARDGAVGQQRMSFAMWHLLLHKLGVQRA